MSLYLSYEMIVISEKKGKILSGIITCICIVVALLFQFFTVSKASTVPERNSFMISKKKMKIT